MICEIGLKTYYKDCIHLILVYLCCFKPKYRGFKAVIKSIVISPIKVEEGSTTFEIFCCWIDLGEKRQN